MMLLYFLMLKEKVVSSVEFCLQNSLRSYLTYLTLLGFFKILSTKSVSSDFDAVCCPTVA